MTENTETFGHESIASHSMNGGQQWLFRFPNGYGASVIQGPYSYGGPAGLYELAVVTWDGNKHSLTYGTPITDDVLGYLTEADVAETLRKIEELAPAAPQAVTR